MPRFAPAARDRPETVELPLPRGKKREELRAAAKLHAREAVYSRATMRHAINVFANDFDDEGAWWENAVSRILSVARLLFANMVLD